MWFNRKITPFLGLGISSQAPLNLIGGLLMLWARESGLDLKKVGLFAAVTLPYCLKFLWAPFVDRVNLPWADAMGRKKAWCLLWQICVVIGLLAISCLDPAKSPMALFGCAFFIAFSSAGQDLAMDGLRIDTLKGDDLNNGTVLCQLGNRVGFFIATAGMISLSDRIPWSMVYKISVFTVIIGIVSLFFIKEEKSDATPANFDTMVAAPFRDFLKRGNLLLLCIFVVLYKLCNGMLGKVAYPFYYDIGFTKDQIALVSATFGTCITTLGVFCGGWVLKKFKFKPMLFWLGVIEIFTSLAFSLLAAVGPDIKLFFAVILFDNIVGGIGGAVWTVYLSRLCSRSFSATQYSFLNALTMVPLTLLATSGGWLASRMGWPVYFAFTGVLMLPALVVIAVGKSLFNCVGDGENGDKKDDGKKGDAL